MKHCLLTCRFILPRIQYSGSPQSAPKFHFEIPPTVKIFENNKLNPNLFRIITAISGLQLVLWSYLSYFALMELNVQNKEAKTNKNEQSLDETGNSATIKSESKQEYKEKGNTESSSAGYKWFMSSKWRLFLSALSLSAGIAFASVAYIYPLRMVKAVTYIRPTQSLKIVTYSPWGSSRNIEVPLVDIVCNTTSAQQAQGHNIAIKIKDYTFFFLLNSRNTYSHSLLNSLVLSRKKI